MKTIGIVAHSFEGGSLCFVSACNEGGVRLGAHMHPPIVLSAVPMGLSMPGWESENYDEVAVHLRKGVEQVAAAGAEFYICPDNTAHIVLEEIAGILPIPGLHIAEVVCRQIETIGCKRVGLLGTRWTMVGPVYDKALKVRNLEKLIPEPRVRSQINSAIFDELCQGIFKPETTDMFLDAIRDLKDKGAECAILGCTEIPIIVNAANSPLPVLDSTRLLAKYAVEHALSSEPGIIERGWIR